MEFSNFTNSSSYQIIDNIRTTSLDLSSEIKFKYLRVRGYEGYASVGDYICIKSITCDVMNLPPLPTDFIPTVSTLESKLSLEQRIARIEQTLRLDDHADIQ